MKYASDTRSCCGESEFVLPDAARGTKKAASANAHLIASQPSKPAQERFERTKDNVGTVFGIIDRVFDGSVYRYRVQWRDEPGGHRWPDSWEPGTRLRDKGLAGACNIVDLWKRSQNSCFYKFCKLNGHATRIGASPPNDCALYGIRMAAQLIGSFDWGIEIIVDEFRKFANERCSEPCQRLSLPILYRSLMSGVNGFSAGARLRTLSIPCGVYLCAAFDSKRCTHCIVIQVTADAKRVFDYEHDGVAMSIYVTAAPPAKTAGEICKKQRRDKKSDKSAFQRLKTSRINAHDVTVKESRVLLQIAYDNGDMSGLLDSALAMVESSIYLARFKDNTISDHGAFEAVAKRLQWTCSSIAGMTQFAPVPFDPDAPSKSFAFDRIDRARRLYKVATYGESAMENRKASIVLPTRKRFLSESLLLDTADE
ncbi:unnamed protein product [Phytophthora fragariaefolia]|uniref:Unnamed protein product n=1 Tax=Phytophthora fragariaefolia TaxID=1490495 RepID=A0A9W7D3Y8_9STRA|nr:unnamed protein product [Phytophthora fragariaefolia]